MVAEKLVFSARPSKHCMAISKADLVLCGEVHSHPMHPPGYGPDKAQNIVCTTCSLCKYSIARSTDAQGMHSIELYSYYWLLHE